MDLHEVKVNDLPYYTIDAASGTATEKGFFGRIFARILNFFGIRTALDILFSASTPPPSSSLRGRVQVQESAYPRAVLLAAYILKDDPEIKLAAFQRNYFAHLYKPPEVLIDEDPNGEKFLEFINTTREYLARLENTGEAVWKRGDRIINRTAIKNDKVSLYGTQMLGSAICTKKNFCEQIERHSLRYLLQDQTYTLSEDGNTLTFWGVWRVSDEENDLLSWESSVQVDLKSGRITYSPLSRVQVAAKAPPEKVNQLFQLLHGEV